MPQQQLDFCDDGCGAAEFAFQIPARHIGVRGPRPGHAARVNADAQSRRRSSVSPAKFDGLSDQADLCCDLGGTGAIRSDDIPRISSELAIDVSALVRCERSALAFDGERKDRRQGHLFIVDAAVGRALLQRQETERWRRPNGLPDTCAEFENSRTAECIGDTIIGPDLFQCGLPAKPLTEIRPARKI